MKSANKVLTLRRKKSTKKPLPSFDDRGYFFKKYFIEGMD